MEPHPTISPIHLDKIKELLTETNLIEIEEEPTQRILTENSPS